MFDEKCTKKQIDNILNKQDSYFQRELSSLKNSIIAYESLSKYRKLIGIPEMIKIMTTTLINETTHYINGIVDMFSRFIPTSSFVINFVFFDYFVPGCINRIKCKDKELCIIFKNIIENSINNITKKDKFVYGSPIGFKYILLFPKIKNRMENKITPILDEMKQDETIRRNIILMIMAYEFPDLFKEYVKEIYYRLMNNNIRIDSRAKIISVIFNISLIQAENLCGKQDSYALNFYIDICRELISNEIELVKYGKSSLNKINFDNDIWVYYFKKYNGLYSKTMRFDSVNNKQLKFIVKCYFKQLIEEGELRGDKDSLKSQIDCYHRVVISVNYFINTFKITAFSDISFEMLRPYTQYLENECTFRGKKLSPKTIASYKDKMSEFIEWVIYADKITVGKPISNLFKKVKYLKVDKHIKNTKSLSEDTLSSIINTLEEIEDEMIQKIITVMLNTPRRFKEVANLEEDCLIPSENGQYVLKYIPWKIRNHVLVKNPGDQYQYCKVNDTVVNEIKKQMQITKELRELYKMKEIFIYKYKGKGFGRVDVLTNTDRLNKSLNRVLEKYINDIGKVSTRNYRKTIAVNMIINGATLEEVRQVLGQFNTKTTETYYAEVNKILIADKNSEFFIKEFEDNVGKENLKRYSEIEKEELFTKFCIEYRRIFYKRSILGTCKRSPVTLCKKRISGNEIACATCDKLCTGKPHLNTWVELKKDAVLAKEVLQEFYINVLKLRDEEYMMFEEYKNIIKQIYDYENVINVIERCGETNER